MNLRSKSVWIQPTTFAICWTFASAFKAQNISKHVTFKQKHWYLTQNNNVDGCFSALIITSKNKEARAFQIDFQSRHEEKKTTRTMSKRYLPDTFSMRTCSGDSSSGADGGEGMTYKVGTNQSLELKKNRAKNARNSREAIENDRPNTLRLERNLRGTVFGRMPSLRSLHQK